MRTERRTSGGEWIAAVVLTLVGCSGDDEKEPQQMRPVTINPAAGSSAAGSGASATAGTGARPPSAGTSASPTGSAGRAPINPPVAGTASPPSAAGAPAAGAPPVVPAVPPVVPPPAATPTAAPWNTSGKTCLMAGSGKYGEPGPYKVGRMEVDLGMISPNQGTGKFTIAYPMPLEASCLHPIVAWGNGTTVTGYDTYAFFNDNAASWGMVVIASHESNTGSGAFHKAAIDHMLKQNDDPMSMFYKKLSPRVGVSGHSQGAGGAAQGATHPNVSVDVGVGGPASVAAKIAMMCLTGTEDIAATSCPASVDRAQGPAFAASWEGGDHVGTQTIAGYIGRDPGTLAMQRLMAAWFRCYLADDSVACDLFKGAAPDACGLCKEGQNWAVLKSKNVN
jgi:hypothetical protein